jgi:hypothetical protein
MPRGSMPGQRRGGRRRATPNGRTILVDRILAAAAVLPAASAKEFLTTIVNDQELPAETRLAVLQRRLTQARGKRPAKARALTRAETGQKASAAGATNRRGARAMIEGPAVEGGMDLPHLEALFGIVRCATAAAKVRRSAAYVIAKFLLPAKPVNKTWRSTPDKYGFCINPDIAKEYRDKDFELRKLKKHPNQHMPAIAQKMGKLQARRDAIFARLRCPCPSCYGAMEFREDMSRLDYFWSKRENDIPLTEEEDAEEAHFKARYDSFAEGPEQIARRRRQRLERADQKFRAGRFFKEPGARVLSRKNRNDLRLLRLLYPAPASVKRDISEGIEDIEDIRCQDHPFAVEEPDSDGNFYTFDAPLVGMPPFIYSNPGYPPYSELPLSAWPKTKQEWEELMRGR